MNSHLTNFQRRRKALLVLPLLVIPFLTMAFWAMGGGKMKTDGTKEKEDGINLQLPHAQLGDDKDKTKLSFYESQAKVGSIAADSAMELSFQPEKGVPEVSASLANKSGYSYDPISSGSFSAKDPAEIKVYRRLDELNKALATQSSSTKKEKAPAGQRKEVQNLTEDVDRLADMMESVQEKKESDPELEQLTGMMERILDIQHPDRVKERLKEQSVQNKKGVYPVSRYKMEVKVSLLVSRDKNDSTKQYNTFLNEQSQRAEGATKANTVTAAIGEDAVATAGSTIKLRLLTDVYVGGMLIPKGTFVFGTAALSEDRLKVSIPAIQYKENLFPVSLHVYDLDGLEGIRVPGSISRDVAKGTAEQSLQSVGLLSLDPSLKAQVTAAGVQAAKGLLSKKVKLLKVSLKTGYQVLLKDENGQQ
ncbi:conjugative transposon protein TraM [Flavisolibacter sp. BT320]|nr:conjugative transposon protein TraM [Flavisolibacter longurius]